MREFKIGDVVEVIRKNYPLDARPLGGNKLMFQPADTKEYPKDSLKLVPSSWINRDYSSYFKSMDGARTNIDAMALNMKKYLDIAQKEYMVSNLADYPTLMTSSLIKRVVFSDRKTIILWNDGSKTIVSCAEGEQFDPYMGFCAAFTKGFFGSKHQVEKMVKNADYQSIKKTKKKISEVLTTSKELSNALKQLQNCSRYYLNE